MERKVEKNKYYMLKVKGKKDHNGYKKQEKDTEKC